MERDHLRAGILIVSDTAAEDSTTDKSGALLGDVFRHEGGEQWTVAEREIVHDNEAEIQRCITQWCDGDTPLNLIVTTGGTGFAIKDNTPEAVAPLIHRHAPGLVHGMLAASLAVTPFALMSRPVAGVRQKTLILTLPGSPKGAKENLQAVLKLLPHACTQAAGADSRAAHEGGVKKLEREAGVSSGSASVVPTSQGGDSHSRQHHHHHGHGHGGHRGPVPHTDASSKPLSNDPRDGPSRRNRSSPYRMLSVDEALKLIAEHTSSPEATTVHVKRENVIGTVLARDVQAEESVPAFRASIVDGYAVKIPSSRTFEKGVYPVAMVSHAQPGEISPLDVGQVARITTGAPLPPGADAVVMVEDTVLTSRTDDGGEEKEVEILTSAIKAGENVREIGSDVRAGEVIMRAGEGISAVGGEFGLLASVGTRSVTVYRKPVVGVLSTGDELVEHNDARSLRIGEVRDTNRPTLLTVVREAGFDVTDLGIVSDKPGTLESTLRSALQRVDVLITTGGVSMGELDLLKPTIERSLGGTIHFGRVAMKPGKPTTFATVSVKMPSEGKRVTRSIFALPGNPASAVVTFQVFVQPALRQAAGMSPVGLPRIHAKVDGDVRRDTSRLEYHRAIVLTTKDGLIARSTGMQRSSRIGSFKAANALLIVDPGEGAIKSGEMVEALLMGQLLQESLDETDT